MIRKPLFVLVLLLASSAGAEEKVLVPIAIQNRVPGAFGSLWETRVSLFNRSAVPLQVEGAFTPCYIDPCLTLALPPRATISLSPYATFEAGKFFFVETGRTADLEVDLRVQDVSRQAETWGTEVPVVPESAASRDPIDLLDVPAGGDFRSLVRIYDFDPEAGHSVVVRFYRHSRDAVETDQLLAEVPLILRVPANMVEFPGYAEVSLGSVALGDVERVRIEVVPATPNLRFWAFASITNNATQHVTLVTP